MVPLGDDLLVPPVALASFARSTPEATEQVVRAALKSGCRHLSVTDVFGNASPIGDALKTSGVSREEVWVTVKLWPKNRVYEDIISAFNRLLFELGVSYVDLVLLHSPINRSNRLEQWRAIETIKSEGKARAIGLSNCESHHIEEILKNSTILPVLHEAELSLFMQRTDMVDFCADNGISTAASEPLAKGLRQGYAPLLDLVQRKNDELAGTLVNGPVTPELLVLRWVLQRGLIAVVSPEHVRVALQAAEAQWMLSEDENALISTWDEGLETAWKPSEEEDAML